MKITLIKKNKIKKFLLPSKILGNFWIEDINDKGNEQNLINIEAINGKWELVSNNDFYCLNSDKQKMNRVVLDNYSFYNVYDRQLNTNYLIYTSPDCDINVSFVDISSVKEITIGKNSSNNISYNFQYMDDITAKIIIEGNNIKIIDNNSRYGIYIDSKKIDGESLVNYGEIIFILGLKLFVFRDENNLILSINNPNNMVTTNLSFYQIQNNESKFFEGEDEIELEQYSSNSYFHKKPRFKTDLIPLEIQIDPPPIKEEKDDNSVLLTIGPMLTMSLTSVVMGYSAVNNVINNNGTWSSAAPSIVICVAMLASTLLWPLINKNVSKKRAIRIEKDRQKKYSEYIESKKIKIQEAIASQKSIILNTYPSVAECIKIIMNMQTNLWERRIEDNDFLTVNLGYGNMPMKIDIKYPEEHFSMFSDNLKEIVNKLGSEPKNLIDVSITLSFIDENKTAMVGNIEDNMRLVRNILVQLMAFHSYDDLKIVLLTNEDNKNYWDFLKSLPHCWSNDHTIRYFATNNDEYKELCYNLERIYASRKENEKFDFKDNKPYYLIISDAFKNIRNFDFVEKILNDKNNYGFSTLVLTDKMVSLPDQCHTFIQNLPDKSLLFKNVNANDNFKFEIEKINYSIDECAKKLSNIPIIINNDNEGQIPDKLGFLEMYDVGKIEQLNCINRWERNTPILNIQAPIGIGKSGELINLDLHEKFHGPHGLIAGMTGSGKSEFILTYILSLAVNYHPYEVQFILIDYKGGGLAGAFENKATGIKLPHVVGTITNLDANEINRSFASLDSELKRRQRAFNKARDLTGESTIDIYKYQKMYRDHIIDEPVSHLFIIADEFAEMKQQQPEFMQQLISTARIGRSLGVHLILATQKPSGVVDPQIWSNTRFRVCLRVQDKSDSTEVIKRPDAAYLKQTGRFYLQVGYNEVFTIGQAAWAGGKYNPSEKIKKELDTSINFVDNIGYSIKKVSTRKQQISVSDNGEELTNIVEYLSDIAKKQNIVCKPLWLDKIPAEIMISDLAKKYNYNVDPLIVNPIIGEYDVPNMQEQHLLTLPFSKSGNALIYGSAGSGKENLLTTMIYSSMLFHKPVDINYYIVDCGAEVLKCFRNSPFVGDICYINDNEKIKNLYKMISKIIEDRKKIFAEYNGDFITYCKDSGKKLPNIVIVINNYETYQETFSMYDDLLVVLTRDCIKYGIYFVLTVSTPNGLRFKLKQNFQQVVSLQQNNEDDYNTILGNVHKIYPSKIFGRGIIKIDNIYEFQTALVDEKEKIYQTINEKNKEYSKDSYRALPIPTLPNIVSYYDIKQELGTSLEYVIGISKGNLDIVKYDFSKDVSNIVTSQDLSVLVKFIYPLIKQISDVNKKSILVINAEDFILDLKNSNNLNYFNNNFNNVFEQLFNIITKSYDLYEKNNFSNSIFQKNKKLICFIIGLESFKSKLNEKNKGNFSIIFEKSKDLSLINYVLIDTVDNIKKNEYETWYKNTVNENNGIWIGNGINDQFVLKTNSRTEETKENLLDNMCFTIKRGNPCLVKYVEDYEKKD